MKKVWLFLFLVLVILGAVFYKQILATIDFYQYQNDNKATYAKSTITWKQIPFTSTGNTGVASDLLVFGSLRMPVPFTASKSSGTDAGLAVGGTKSIEIARSAETSDFFSTHNFSTEEKASACQFLSKTSSLGACTSNHNLYRAFLELNQDDMHVFSSLSDKKLYNSLQTIRAGVIPSNIVSGFETRIITGFLFTIDSGNYVADVFDNQDQMYRIKFTNLPQSDVAFVLSNLSRVVE